MDGESPSSRSASPETQPLQACQDNFLLRLVGRADHIDWRYKLQLTIVFSLAIIITTYLLRSRISGLGDYGYLGAFIVNGISSATIILPTPGGAVIAIIAKDFNPLLIGIAAGLGGTLGSLTAYIVGLANCPSTYRSRWFGLLERLMRRRGGAIIFAFSLIPLLPGDLAAILAGIVRYPVRKYLFYNGLASMILMTSIAYVGADFANRLERFFTEWVKAFF